jgi:putative flippase GtrA
MSLLGGILAGVTISFAMSKLFAFNSSSWRGAGSELARFLLVYAIGCGLYWLTAVAASGFIAAQGVSERLAEPAGVLIGAGAMMVTTYFGHRFYTYKTHRKVAPEVVGSTLGARRRS